MRSPCPIANTLDLLGDKWTLLVVRDLLLFEKHRFAELAGSYEGIPTNILADRLRRLESCGIVTKVPYQEHPVRHEYILTQKGRELFPVLKEMILWAQRNIPGVGRKPPGDSPVTLEDVERRIRAQGEAQSESPKTSD
jgi:DNA-binding HxlR family transcriptional regulator